MDQMCQCEQREETLAPRCAPPAFAPCPADSRDRRPLTMAVQDDCDDAITLHAGFSLSPLLLCIRSSPHPAS